MEIRLEGISKRFNREWIFKNLSQIFKSGKSYAVIGPNGSGKSTLLQIIAGWMLPNEGTVSYFENTGIIDPDSVYLHLDFVAPYVELIEDFTVGKKPDLRRIRVSQCSAAHDIGADA